LMLLGDFLAYIDIFSALFLLGILSRATTILFIVKQMTVRVAQLASRLMTEIQRLDFRHRRVRGANSSKRPTGRSKTDDDDPVVTGGFAWA
jgi:hypothetical protein